MRGTNGNHPDDKRLCPIDLSRPDNSGYDKGAGFPRIALWHFVGLPLFRSSILPISSFKCWLLRAFGAKVGRGVYIKPSVRVKFPWYLDIGDHSWIGEDAWIDNLAQVKIGPNACISQGVYLCTGNHDWSSANMKLFRRGITVHQGAWVGARASICPGVTIGTCAVVALGSVVQRDVPEYQIWGGNPAAFIKQRVIHSLQPQAESAHSS